MAILKKADVDAAAVVKQAAKRRPRELLAYLTQRARQR